MYTMNALSQIIGLNMVFDKVLCSPLTGAAWAIIHGGACPRIGFQEEK